MTASTGLWRAIFRMSWQTKGKNRSPASRAFCRAIMSMSSERSEPVMA